MSTPTPLLPCPFCGGKGYAAYAEARGCLFAAFCLTDGCGCIVGPFPSLQGAEERWNRRKDPPAVMEWERAAKIMANVREGKWPFDERPE